MSYLEFTTFSGSFYCSGEKLLNKRDRVAVFNTRELLLLILIASLFLTAVGLEFTIIIDKKFLFVNVPNVKMQNQGSFLKIFIINVTQFITFYMNPKLTNVKLGYMYL